MNPIFEVCKILAANIELSPEELKPEFLKRFKAIKNPEIKRILNLVHVKNHCNIIVGLKNCMEPHCLQCLGEEDNKVTCEHGIHITAAERAFHIALTKSLPYAYEDRFKEQKCCGCKMIFKNKNRLKQCECPECVNCVLNKYKDLNVFCGICGRIYEEEEIIKIAKKKGEVEIELVKVCPNCNLPLYAKAFLGNRCFVCSCYPD